MKVVEVVNNLWIPPVWPLRFIQGQKFPEIQGFLSEKLKKIGGNKALPQKFFLPPSPNLEILPSYVPDQWSLDMAVKELAVSNSLKFKSSI